MNDLPGRPRCRDMGISIGRMSPGPHNAITDVPDVSVGHVTLIDGEGPLVPGKGPVRTGVTAVLPHRGNLFKEKVRAAIHVINGFGKACGLAQVAELGVLETPLVLTNTLFGGNGVGLPVVHAETEPGYWRHNGHCEPRRAGVQRRVPKRHTRTACKTAPRVNRVG